MVDKFQLVFSSTQLVVLDVALWFFIQEFKYKNYKINDEEFDKFVEDLQNAYELRKYINSNIPKNDNKYEMLSPED